MIINAATTSVGVPAEYAYIEKKYGKKGIEWDVSSRFHGEGDNGRAFETFIIKLKSGTEVSIHFDIESFYGKF